MKTPKEIVKAGYDSVSYAYRGDQPDDSYQQYASRKLEYD